MELYDLFGEVIREQEEEKPKTLGEMFMDGDSYDICQKRHRGNPESVEANKMAAPSKSKDRARILAYLEDVPSTCEEVERQLGFGRSTVSARMSELKRDGLIEKVGRRPTTTGAMAGVYALLKSSWDAQQSNKNVEIT